MLKTTTKEELISYLKSFNIFNYNDYFYKYVDIIYDKNTSPIKYCTHKHHIIPKYYFKSNKLNIDSTEKNTVILSASNHVLAHYYLIFCLKERNYV